MKTKTCVLAWGLAGALAIGAQTAAALVWMAAGVWAVASVQSVTRMFYAAGDTRTSIGRVMPSVVSM